MRVEVRPRRDDDLPELVEVLADQQPVSRYPVRWPLPFEPERFVRRDDELAAWTLEVDGAVAGHVCVQPVASLLEGAEPQLVALWEESHERPAEQLACLSALFVDHRLWGRGLGGRLHDTAIGWLDDRDLGACLEELPRPGGASPLYARRGWRVAGTARPGWLPAGEGPVLVQWLPRSACRPGPGVATVAS